MASVKVAVRVRPFNQREINLNAVSIIEIEGKKTRINNTKLQVAIGKSEGDVSREKYKDFTFDYSYWSFDSADPHFASQEQVFKDLGLDVVGNAFQGYNACVFAYGQTGSGKTHTMMGSNNSPETQGLIPRICKNMFNRMSEGKEHGTTYRTEVSYLEIYNERVKDLLKKDQSHNLKVREHPKQGPYVEDLSKHLVMDYSDILQVMNRGNANRTTASTNMNDVSSRSHAIFTMTFVQASFIGDLPSETVSKIHLVDLAGSERADASGATGQRLKEGAHINKSLVTLGSVISALAEVSQPPSNVNKPKHTFIPYRDSILTWLLKDSLGGNAKTIMIATISPADCNYGETLSTLRYANRAKNIINKPTINEDVNVKLIKELRAEINKLKTLLDGNVNTIPSDVLEELQKKEAKEKVLTEEWTEKWKETQKILMEQKDLALRKAGTGVVLDSLMPHLIGIDDDLLSTGITLYHLREGETKIGSDDGEEKMEILLRGLGLEPKHCSINLVNGVATLVPFNGSQCTVNGQIIDKPTRLSQGCVILLGRTNMFRYNDPAEAEKLRKEGPRSQQNLSRLSFLSRSSTDLARSSENLNLGQTAEENSILEEKRRQLEAEEARLHKESQELMSQKAELEAQKINYVQLQHEKEEAWKAEQLNKSAAIHLAQKNLEERRVRLEQEYAAHRRRLADDWKRLEQQEQDTLSTLKSKEADLRKRREFLEWELGQEMEIIEVEAMKVEGLKASLIDKQKAVGNFTAELAAELESQLGESETALRPLLEMEEDKFNSYFQNQMIRIEELRGKHLGPLNDQKDLVLQKLKELGEKLKETEDADLRSELNKQLTNLQHEESVIIQEMENIDKEYKLNKNKIDDSSSTLQKYRQRILNRNEECASIGKEVEEGIRKLESSEEKLLRLEADLSLIGDQEKLIVEQLAHIDSSKQKLLTIIENSTEKDEELIPNQYYKSQGGGEDHDHKSIEVSNESNLQGSTETLIPTKGIIGQNHSNGFISGIDPRFESYGGFISPKRDGGSEGNEEELKRLVVQINEQKAIVLESLENDCDKEEMNNHMTVLQVLRNRYLELGCMVDSSSKNPWLFEDDESTFDFDKTEDGTLAGDSELDDSEAHSSFTEDDQIQMLVEQGVERRLREILDQLNLGIRPSALIKRNDESRRIRSSLPSGLNNYPFGSDEEGSSSPQLRQLPRSISMGSNIWALTHGGDNVVIPGVLEITIPAFFIRGSGNQTHFEYEILIVTPMEKWSVLRRYNRFRDLRDYMKNKYGLKVAKISFPPRKFFGRRSEKVASERRLLLQTFLHSLIRVCSSLPTCPLFNIGPNQIKTSLIAFASFFEKGIFDSTKYGTS